ncbi:MAG: translation elongation factor Ts [Verrucomicrobia bacterium]|nr:translation elongation factor Ts [Verrucomicrobiota bacterium]
MAEITAAVVGKLRSMTNAGMMDCKKALVETDGDIEAAVDLLRKKGIATAAKKAGREASDGVIAQHIMPGAKTGVLVEVNCETDFVAKNEEFRAFCNDLAEKLAQNPDIETEELRTAQVAKMGENIQISRFERLQVQGNGMVAAYIHTGAKVGVLVEVGADKEETNDNDDFRELVKDITLQIAAANPVAVSREQVPADVVEKEKEIAGAQVQGKPEHVIDKIVQGKLDKFFQNICLLEQGYVKQGGEISLQEHINTVAKSIGDEIQVRRFVRFQVGE